ncbi:hypothetical protein M0802_009055 [Mischocyttarus mexicanus]|nr:hypothetical protein M0802_009055 [Mischocyttarus mexicanus]
MENSQNLETRGTNSQMNYFNVSPQALLLLLACGGGGGGSGGSSSSSFEYFETNWGKQNVRMGWWDATGSPTIIWG